MLCRLPLVFAILGLVGGFLGPSNVARAQQAPMTFDAVRIGDRHMCAGGCPLVITATGQITQDTPSQFQDFLERAGGRGVHAVVFLNSPGGRVVASMQFGTILRQIGAAVVVAGVYSDGRGGTVLTNAECFSACVYALMGARKRVIPSKSAVGIHRMFVYEEGLDASGTALVRQRRYDNGDMRAYLMRYTSSMGVNPALIAEAERIPSDHLRILSPAEIRRWRLGVPKL